MNTCTQPDFVFHKQRKYFFVFNSIQVADNNELFVIIHKCCHIFPEQRKRRVCHHNIGFLHKCETFRRAEIAVTLKLCQLVFA